MGLVFFACRKDTILFVHVFKSKTSIKIRIIIKNTILVSGGTDVIIDV